MILFHFFFFADYESMVFPLLISKFHANLTLFSDSNSPEKEGGSILAGYVNGLTALSINKDLQTAIHLHSDTRATLRSYRLGVMAESSIDQQRPATCLVFMLTPRQSRRWNAARAS